MAMDISNSIRDGFGLEVQLFMLTEFDLSPKENPSVSEMWDKPHPLLGREPNSLYKNP